MATTTFTESLVSEMAQNFNEALDGVDPIDLSDDKTLKWRGLLNNKYASAAGRRGGVISKKSNLDTEESISSPPTKSNSQSVDHVGSTSLKYSSNVNDTQESDTQVVKKTIDVGDEKTIPIVKEDEFQNKPKRVLRQKSKPFTTTEMRNVSKRNKHNSQDETIVESEEADLSVTRVVRKSRIKRHSNELFEPKTLRSRRTDQPLLHSTANECDEGVLAESENVHYLNSECKSINLHNLEETENQNENALQDCSSDGTTNVKLFDISSIMCKRQQQSSDEEDSKHANHLVLPLHDAKEFAYKTEESGEEVQNEHAEAIPIISNVESNIELASLMQDTQLSQDLLFPVVSSLNILVPKKRGRKPGFKKLLNAVSTVSKKTSREIDPAFDPASKLSSASFSSEPSIAPSQRLSRRIKPTAKILANDELRYGFELQNNARLSLSSEHLDAEKSPHKDDKNIQIPSPSVETLTKINSPKYCEQPTKVVSELRNSETSPRRRAPCPDPVEFINTIKMEKINLHRSPEDNKKMTIKQRKRLLKLKEKHFYKLGLQRSRISYPDTSHDSSEAEEVEEEFVPNSKVSVGRPNVTLRLRANTITLEKPCTSDAKTRKSKYHESQSNARKRVYTVIPSDKHETSLILSAKKKLVNAISKHNPPPPKELLSTATDNTICLCSKPSKYYIHRTAETTFCRATDEIEGQLIGCCNAIAGGGGDLLNLHRPSVRVKYSLLCSSHVQRLVAHQSCAGCGIFCTQGCFVICPRMHFFHKDCATKFILNAPFNLNGMDFVRPSLVLRCPHCGIDVAPDKEMKITMQCRTVPVFLPCQRQTPKMARMSIGHHTHASGALVQQKSGSGIGQKQFLWELEKLIPPGVIEVLLGANNTGKDGFRSADHKYTTNDVFEAITNDNVHRMAEIIAAGFDISAKLTEFRSGTCLHLVSNFGSLAMSYLILSRSPSVDFLNNRDRELRSALMCAVLGAKNDIIRMLVQCGSDVTLRGPGGMTALHLAAKTGNFTAAQIILDSYRRATSATSFEMFVNAVDDGGWTTIVWAAEIGHSDLVEYLVQCGADLSICDAERNTVLHWAALSDDVATVRPLLLEADLNVQNVNGDTPIHIACRNSNIRMCLMFLAHGASLDLQNDLGETAFDGIGDEDGACAKALLFNMKLRALARFGEQTIVSQDISKGRETYPIKVIKQRKRFTHEQDQMDDTEVPQFSYITKSIIQQSIIQIDRRISQMRVCSCTDNCTSSSCQCSDISVQNWYNAEGRLHGTFNFADPAMIFECNDVCGCNKLHCKNRVVQNGQKVALQVVECAGSKGWGVTAVGDVVRGTFVAEYTGEILTDAEAERRVDDSYFFDLDASEHCIDAHFFGNVSRFFNHSCAPNLVPIRVFYDHQDLRFPKIAFFAIRDICADEEITFDYGDKFWQNKSFFCECGADACRFRAPIRQ